MLNWHSHLHKSHYISASLIPISACYHGCYHSNSARNAHAPCKLLLIVYGMFQIFHQPFPDMSEVSPIYTCIFEFLQYL